VDWLAQTGATFGVGGGLLVSLFFLQLDNFKTEIMGFKCNTKCASGRRQKALTEAGMFYTTTTTTRFSG